MAQAAPDFSLPDQTGTTRQLKDYLGRWLVLFFYPGNASPDCTDQVCEFRDEHTIINQFGNAEIIGINQDPVDYLQQFSQSYRLDFDLLSDKTGEIVKAYGCWEDQLYQGTVFSHVARRTLLINPAGEIVKTYHDINPHGHAAEIIQDLQKLQAGSNDQKQ